MSRVAAQAKHMMYDVLHSRPAEPGRDEIDRATHENQGGSEGLYAMLVLAYTIHKTLFLPVRVGLTAAFTPPFLWDGYDKEVGLGWRSTACCFRNA